MDIVVGAQLGKVGLCPVLMAPGTDTSMSEWICASRIDRNPILEGPRQAGTDNQLLGLPRNGGPRMASEVRATPPQ
jgi:hypothetical protein